LNPFVHNPNDNIPQEYIEKISSADILILQFIKNDRQNIHHEKIKTYSKKNSKIILLPHYVFSGYHVNNIELPLNFDCSKTYSELYQIYNSIKIDDNIILKNYNDSINELCNLNSDIDVSTIMKKYGKKYLMFNSRSYPTNIFSIFVL
jgi:hypothetical protein